MTIWRGQGRTHKGRRPANEDTLVCRDSDGLWAVIDGMGGHDAGDLAATIIRESLGTVALGGGIAHRLMAVESALQSANHAIRPAVLWAGDARLYRHVGEEMTRLTRDHTPVQALVDAGDIDERQAMSHPRAHVIYQAIGNGDKLKLEQARFDLSADQQFLLTTDGVHSVLTVDDLGRLMGQGASESAILKAALNAGSRDNVTAVKVSANGHYE